MSDNDRRYSLGDSHSCSNGDLTVLHRRMFSLKYIGRRSKMNKVSLWNVSPPRWPGAPGARMKPEELALLLKRMYDHSQEKAHLVLWMPSRELHQTHLNPPEDLDPWTPMATIFSGSNRGMDIGYVFAKGATPVDWESTVVPDERGRRGSASSHAMKFVIEKLLKKDASSWVYDTRVVAEPFIHRSGQLPLWTRRCGVHYVGYTSSKKLFESVKEKLDQQELPGIQLSLPAN